MGALPADERFRHCYHVPLGNQWSGVYIVDWLLSRFLDRATAKLAGPDTERSKLVSEFYRTVGPLEEFSKAFEQHINFKALVLLLMGGGRGRVGAPMLVRAQLYRVTVSLISVG